MMKTYKQPITKVFQATGLDRWDPCSPAQPASGQIVRVVQSWGPFRGIEWVTPDGVRHHGSCGKGSLYSLKTWQTR